MFVVLVEFTLHPECFEDFKNRVRQQAKDSLEREPDCHLFDVCTSAERADYVLLYEVYTDKAAFETHLVSAHFHDFDKDVRDWVADKKVSIFERI